MENSASDLAQRLSREAETVCRHYLSNGRKQGHYWIVGDVENAPGRSLYVRLTGPSSGKGAAGKWTDAATGEHGDLLDLIAANLRLATLGETLDEARRFLSLPRPEPPKPELLAKAPTGSPEAARRLWTMGKRITGTLAERYLAGRGIVGVRTVSTLRFHPNCYYWREHRTDKDRPEAWPALLAKVTDSDGNITGLHRTWLDPETANKAPLDPNRKAMGHLLGHGVRIGAAARIVAAGEGLETMLSLRMALARLPVIAALSANHLAALLLPTGIDRLYIAADADKAGRIATEALAERAHEQGIETVPLHFRQGDANEDLRAFGLQDLRAHLRRQLAREDAAILLPSSVA
ncbi:MAG: toprim domain-containing protein [Roseibium sp.]|nr:toprim domain-containing protein [Roseibium sp.]